MNSASTCSITTQVAEQGCLNAGPGLLWLFHPRWQLHLDARWTLAGRTTAEMQSFALNLAYLW